MRIIIFFLYLNFLSISCKGQENEKCTNSEILTKIKKLPQVIDDSIYVTKKDKNIIYQIYNDTIAEKPYKVFKEAVDDQFHVSTLHLFYVDKNCDIFLYDTVKDSLTPINFKRKKMETKTKEVKFTDLFNEGSNIRFSPNDLEKNDVEIQK